MVEPSRSIFSTPHVGPHPSLSTGTITQGVRHRHRARRVSGDGSSRRVGRAVQPRRGAHLCGAAPGRTGERASAGTSFDFSIGGDAAMRFYDAPLEVGTATESRTCIGIPPRSKERERPRRPTGRSGRSSTVVTNARTIERCRARVRTPRLELQPK
jgi:hypothetical protein